MPKPIHACRPGTYPQAGGTVTLTAADLAAAAAAYDPALKECPICLGHPAHDAPAYGWIGSFACDADGFSALPSSLAPELSEALAGQHKPYKHVSMAFYAPASPHNPKPGTYYPRHLGLLGATLPVVPGLRPLELAETDQGLVTIELSDYADGLVADLFRGLRDYLVQTAGLETADRVLPPWSIDQLIRENALEKESAMEDKLAAAPAFSEPTEAVRALQARVAQLEGQLSAQAAAAQAAEQADRHGAHVAFADQLAGQARLAPADAGLVVAVLDALHAGEPLQFGEGDAAQPLAVALQDLLSSLPPRVELGEFATSARAAGGSASTQTDAQIAAQAKALSASRAKAGQPISAAEAVAMVNQGITA